MKPVVGSSLVIGILSIASGCNGDDGGGNNTTPIAFEGEYVDWDSSGASFCGIFMATWTSHDDASVSDVSNPNGRIEMMLPGASRMRIDITAPAQTSECSTPAGAMYAVPGIAIIDHAVFDAGGEYSARAFSTTRQTAFGFDATKAQVMVHVDGTAGAVTLSGTHDATQAFNGTTWAAGDTGENVYFPNVDPSSGKATVEMPGAIGNGEVPVEAGTFTYLTITK